MGRRIPPASTLSGLCAVFDEVYRVLRPDGTFWLNISDTYCGTGDKADHFDPKNPKGRTGQKKAKNYRIPGLKKKDLIGVPWQVAFALRDTGWYLRQEIIWHKTNCMPESVKDRCVKAHESVFLFAKSQRYYFDYKAIREPVAQSTIERSKHAISENTKYAAGAPGQNRQTIKKTRPRMSEELPQF